MMRQSRDARGVLAGALRPRAMPIGSLVWALAVTLVSLGSASAEIVYVGSSTIGDHIIPAAAKVFTAKTGIPLVIADTSGSGKALEMVGQGRAQLAGVSRSLTLSEKQQRIRYEIIGYDAVGVFVHPTNPVASLSRQQLKAVFTGRITNWKEVGGPDAQIVCITEVWGAKRAQMIEFQEHVMDGGTYREDRKEVDRQSDQVTALTADAFGITAASFAFTRPGVKAVAINGFSPEPNNVRSGAYILSRPLLLVSPARPSAEVKQFLDFMLTLEGQKIVAGKFVPVR